jgi:hypothetical protein
MDELLLRVLSRLVAIHASLGPDVYRDAVRRALLGVAVAAQIEAERRAGSEHTAQGVGTIIRFPLRRARLNPGEDDGTT